MSMQIREATEADLEGIAAIHNRAILDTTQTWHWDPIDLPARKAWFDEQHANDRPVLIAEIDGKVAGFAGYGPFRAYAGYRDTVENSVYVDPMVHQRGIGRALMEPLIAAARQRKMRVMVAAIALPNLASVALHRGLGFIEVGTMPQVGLKFGRYHDLYLMQLML